MFNTLLRRNKPLALISRLAFVLALILAASSQALSQSGQERRVALVVGNNDYRNVAKLDNAVADARVIAKEFRALGFEVIEKLNVDQRSMKAAVRDFVQRISNGGVGAFFYAGHGVQDGGNNYLLPVDTGALTDTAALADEAVELNGDVMARVGQAGAKFSLIVIDACRDNPFPKKAGRSIGSTRGLTVASNAPEGMVVVYSAGVGQQALDRLGDHDRDPNGLFTREFVKEMRKPGLEVAELVRNVRKRVKDQAASVKHDQTPAIYIQADRFYLVSNSQGITIQSPVTGPDEAFWAQMDVSRPCEYQAYLEQYPQGRYTALARQRLKDCPSTATEAVTPAVAFAEDRSVVPGALAGSRNTDNVATAIPSTLQKFALGQERLSCGTSCSVNFGSNRSQLKRWHDAQLWSELATRVLEVGYDNDLAYYYLGRAAEGLGYSNSAITYYLLAEAARKCNGMFNNCNGFNFPQDIHSSVERIKNQKQQAALGR